jgi:hypothetical protein
MLKKSKTRKSPLRKRSLRKSRRRKSPLRKRSLRKRSLRKSRRRKSPLRKRSQQKSKTRKSRTRKSPLRKRSQQKSKTRKSRTRKSPLRKRSQQKCKKSQFRSRKSGYCLKRKCGSGRTRDIVTRICRKKKSPGRKRSLKKSRRRKSLLRNNYSPPPVAMELVEPDYPDVALFTKVKISDIKKDTSYMVYKNGAPLSDNVIIFDSNKEIYFYENKEVVYHVNEYYIKTDEKRQDMDPAFKCIKFYVKDDEYESFIIDYDSVIESKIDSMDTDSMDTDKIRKFLNSCEQYLVYKSNFSITEGLTLDQIKCDWEKDEKDQTIFLDFFTREEELSGNLDKKFSESYGKYSNNGMKSNISARIVGSGFSNLISVSKDGKAVVRVNENLAELICLWYTLADFVRKYQINITPVDKKLCFYRSIKQVYFLDGRPSFIQPLPASYTYNINEAIVWQGTYIYSILKVEIDSPPFPDISFIKSVHGNTDQKEVILPAGELTIGSIRLLQLTDEQVKNIKDSKQNSYISISKTYMVIHCKLKPFSREECKQYISENIINSEPDIIQKFNNKYIETIRNIEKFKEKIEGDIISDSPNRTTSPPRKKSPSLGIKKTSKLHV